jgi:alpha-L-rhamnosidase
VASAEALTVRDLKCEYKVNPIGIDVAKPRLSWKLTSAARGVKQSAYELRTALRKEKLEAGRQLL